MERFLAEIEFFNWDAGMDRSRPFQEAVVPDNADLLHRLDEAGYRCRD